VRDCGGLGWVTTQGYPEQLLPWVVFCFKWMSSLWFGSRW
jgi:hypothetical protein